jgi:hypothetical protein
MTAQMLMMYMLSSKHECAEIVDTERRGETRKAKEKSRM